MNHTPMSGYVPYIFEKQDYLEQPQKFMEYMKRQNMGIKFEINVG